MAKTPGDLEAQIDRCRRLADSIHDDRMRDVLEQLAEELQRQEEELRRQIDDDDPGDPGRH